MTPKKGFLKWTKTNTCKQQFLSRSCNKDGGLKIMVFNYILLRGLIIPMLNHDLMLKELSLRMHERRFVCLCGPAFKGIIPLFWTHDDALTEKLCCKPSWGCSYS